MRGGLYRSPAYTHGHNNANGVEQRRSSRLCFAASALLCLLLRAGPAAAQTVSFKVTPPAEKPKLAETFRLRLELTCPSEYTVRPDTSSFSNGTFEVLQIKKLSSGTEGALKTEVFDLDVSAFAIGISTFPATTWLLSAGTELKEARSPAVPLEILPLFDTKKEPDGIRDIQPPFKFIPWLGLLAGLAAAALAARYIYRQYKNRPGLAGGGYTASAADLRSPYEKALAALAELCASKTWEEGKVKEFYSRLSDIFRTYLDAQFRIKAELMTTNDITRELRGTGADIKTVIKTREMLENADLVKFAKFKPGEKERDAAVGALKDLLIFFTQQDENKRILEAAAKAAEGPGKT